VAGKVVLIGSNSGLSDDELKLVELCAWFHDSAYFNGPENHEAESAKIATGFLSSKGIGETTIVQVKNCILATRIPQQPNDLLARVLCDADMAHLAETNYFERIEKMREEWNHTAEHKISRRKFHKISEKFFRQHAYFTDFAKKELQEKKEQNLQLIQKEIYRMELKKEKKLLQSSKEKTKSKRYSRGVESMFRNTARMQINLSSIADNKSNILISVNAIIISITMTVLVSRFEETPNIILPTLIFLSFSLVTIVFAILSTRPHIS
jgi:predicted metal-dependent HD superfamily phosphohydrolase